MGYIESLRQYQYRRRARRILRSLDGRYSDDPLVDAYNDAKASGQLGDMTFRQFTGSRRRSWRDRRIDARIARLSR